MNDPDNIGVGDEGLGDEHGFYCDDDRHTQEAYKRNKGRLIEDNPYTDLEEFPDESSLFIGDLSRTVTEDMLLKLFSECGPVDGVDIKRDKVTKNNLGYGFVKFKDRQQAERAKHKMNGYEIGGRAIRIGWAQKNTNLFVCLVGDVEERITGEHLRDIFSDFGPIYEEDTFVKRNKYGFVKFKHRAHAEKAKAALDGKHLMLQNGYKTQKPVRIGWGDANTQRNCVHVQFEQNSASNVDLKEEDFKQQFQKFGVVNKVSLPRYSDKRLKGYGFIHFEENDEGEESAARAITELTASQIKGVVIMCNFGKRQNQRHKRFAQKKQANDQNYGDGMYDDGGGMGYGQNQNDYGNNMNDMQNMNNNNMGNMQNNMGGGMQNMNNNMNNMQNMQNMNQGMNNMNPNDQQGMNNMQNMMGMGGGNNSMMRPPMNNMQMGGNNMPPNMNNMGMNNMEMGGGPPMGNMGGPMGMNNMGGNMQNMQNMHMSNQFGQNMGNMMPPPPPNMGGPPLSGPNPFIPMPNNMPPPGPNPMMNPMMMRPPQNPQITVGQLPPGPNPMMNIGNGVPSPPPPNQMPLPPSNFKVNKLNNDKTNGDIGGDKSREQGQEVNNGANPQNKFQLPFANLPHAFPAPPAAPQLNMTGSNGGTGPNTPTRIGQNPPMMPTFLPLGGMNNPMFGGLPGGIPQISPPMRPTNIKTSTSTSPQLVSSPPNLFVPPFPAANPPPPNLTNMPNMHLPNLANMKPPPFNGIPSPNMANLVNMSGMPPMPGMHMPHLRFNPNHPHRSSPGPSPPVSPLMNPPPMPFIPSPQMLQLNNPNMPPINLNKPPMPPNMNHPINLTNKFNNMNMHMNMNNMNIHPINNMHKPLIMQNNNNNNNNPMLLQRNNPQNRPINNQQQRNNQ